MDNINANNIIPETKMKSVEVSRVIGTDYTYKHKIVWKNAIGFLILHILALCGVILMIYGGLMRKIVLWTIIVLFFSGQGITTGAHRYFTHKTYKATPALRIILMIFQTIAGQFLSQEPRCNDAALFTRRYRYNDEQKTSMMKIYCDFKRCRGDYGILLLYGGGLCPAVDFNKLMIMIAHITYMSLGIKNSIFTWARDHRLHHRYSDTDADPHNAKRGFFFCHMGWLMSEKHPYVRVLGKKIDMSDLKNDRIVMFQKKYYPYLYLLFALFLPVWVPVHFFDESWLDSLLICYFFRYVLLLHITWTVNSLAHLYGTRPYDRKLLPVESWFVSFISLGEGWHNYHHAFPWDYKTAELSMHFNITATIIRFLEKIGWAYDLKTASPEMVSNRIVRTGDGTHYKLGDLEPQAVTTAFGPLHPLNPTYNTNLKVPDVILKPGGLPLFHENDTLDDQIPENGSTSGKESAIEPIAESKVDEIMKNGIQS